MSFPLRMSGLSVGVKVRSLSQGSGSANYTLDQFVVFFLKLGCCTYSMRFNLCLAEMITTALSTSTGRSGGKHGDQFLNLSWGIIYLTSDVIELLSVLGRTQNYKFEHGSDRSTL